MGRSAYTPQTVSYIVHSSERDGANRHSSSANDGTSSGSGSGSPDDGSTAKPPTLEDLLFVGRGNVGSSRRAGTGSTNGDPVTWSQCKFDPDDERLPVVTERPVGPDDFLNTGSSYTALRSRRTIDDDEDDGDDDDDDEVMFAAPVDWSPRADNPENDEDEDEVDDEENELDEEDDVDENEDEMPSLSLQQGNGGYYDFPTSTRARSANSQPTLAPPAPAHTHAHATAAASLDGFSPSVGVFHTHTLPFNLPHNPNELHVQRRLVSASSATGNPAIPF